MKRIINRLFLASGVICIFYYVLCGVAVRFDQSMLWVWPVVGAGLILRYALVRCGVELPKWPKMVLRTACCLMLAVFFAVQCLVLTGMFEKCPAGVDYIILLGAKTGSVTIERRIDTAADYLKENPETLVVCTGGQGADEEMPEGEYMKLGLIERGVSEDRIITENRSTSTYENLLYSRELIEDENASVAVVSNNYHIFRAKALARSRFKGDVYGIAMASNPLTLPHYMAREFFTVVVDALRGNLAF